MMTAQVCTAHACSCLKACPAAAAAHLFLQHLVAWSLLLVLLHPCFQANAALWLWQWVLHYLAEACSLQECCCACCLIKHYDACHLRWSKNTPGIITTTASGMNLQTSGLHTHNAMHMHMHMHMHWIL
jgi:hypothetical protein